MAQHYRIVVPTTCIWPTFRLKKCHLTIYRSSGAWAGVARDHQAVFKPPSRYGLCGLDRKLSHEIAKVKDDNSSISKDWCRVAVVSSRSGRSFGVLWGLLLGGGSTRGTCKSIYKAARCQQILFHGNRRGRSWRIHASRTS